MNMLNTYIRQHPVISYFILTFVLTWGGMALVIGLDGFPIASEQLETLGPLVYIAMLIGPSVAGILMTYLLDKGQGLRELRSHLLKWRVNIRWYAITLLTAPIVALVILLVLSLLSPEFSPALLSADNKLMLLLSWFVGGFMIGLFEELGWTGFAVPRMRKHYSMITTGLVVGFLWGAWHFLPFWEIDSFTATLPFALLLARLFSWLPPYRILMVWVYDRTESLLLVILMHASLVATLQIIVPIELAGSHLLIWLVAWAIALWIIATGVVSQQYQKHIVIQQDNYAKSS